ncbi:enzymatic polyprotein endonuclease reverse [Vespula squamosa]|uniref:Enzymatic polyprotein endonuclease reverse n=1 Tax=Vespula squamosa TaxID=30214 RepID=A0ABD2AVY2_VESSQ
MHKAQAYFTIAYFTIVSGIPLDIGTKELADNGKQQAISETTFGRVKVTKKNKRYYIALPVKERLSVSTQLEILDEALHSLFDAALELQLETIAISRGPVGDVPWDNVKSKLRSIFSELPKLSNEEACRLKPHQPTTITDTPGKAFDKISLDIVNPLSTTAIGNSSILIIQDL